MRNLIVAGAAALAAAVGSMTPTKRAQHADGSRRVEVPKRKPIAVVGARAADTYRGERRRRAREVAKTQMVGGGAYPRFHELWEWPAFRTFGER